MKPLRKIIDGDVVYECQLCLGLHSMLTDANNCCSRDVSPEQQYGPRKDPVVKWVVPDHRSLYGKDRY